MLAVWPVRDSGTALAMFGRRLEMDPLARARLSHGIRLATSEDNWLLVNSASLDELAQRPHSAKTILDVRGLANRKVGIHRMRSGWNWRSPAHQLRYQAKSD